MRRVLCASLTVLSHFCIKYLRCDQVQIVSPAVTLLPGHVLLGLVVHFWPSTIAVRALSGICL